MTKPVHSMIDWARILRIYAVDEYYRRWITDKDGSVTCGRGIRTDEHKEAMEVQK